MAHQNSALGRPHRRVDGLGKVTGKARYAADLSASGMLHGRILLARRPHARILAIDTRRARALTGVRAVLTADDLPAAKTFGVVIRNQPVLAIGKVRHFGDGVAMVAADTPEIAARALALIDVTYEDLPGVFDPEEAMAPDAPIIHEADEAAPPLNTCIHHRIRKGDLRAGFAGATLTLARTYRTQHIEHAYLEPEAVLAEDSEEGGVRVIGSIQNTFSTRRSLAAVLALDLARVTVKHAVMGGSFGGKDEVMTQMACRAALLARATGRPVKIVNTREDSMLESYKRHPYILHYKVGADAAGKLTALEARLIADAGAYASMSPFVTWRSAVQVTGPYEVPHVAADVFAAYTNNCYTGAMRGFGSPQVNFAIESLMDELATELEIDPLEIRRRNLFKQGSITATGQRLENHTVSIGDALERAAERAEWSVRRAAPQSGQHVRGIGLACSYRGVSLGAEGVDAAGAIVSVQSDGSVIVSIGLTDMGQGLASAMALIAAEVLGIDTARVKFLNVHTGRVPDSGPTVASRSTIMGGQATKKAAEAVRDVLFEVAADAWSCAIADLRIAHGAIHGPAGETIAFDDLVARAYALGKPLLGFGWHRSPTTSWDEATGTGDAYFTFVYSANVAEVEVDLATGKVDVLRVTAAHDVGKAISPAMVKNQIYGGIAMGMGMATLERYALEEGLPAGTNFDEYLLVTALDMPEVEAVIVENPDPHGPFGAKSIGEPATELAVPAILNAIAHATGKRIRVLPADLESVLLGHPLRKGSLPQ